MHPTGHITLNASGIQLMPRQALIDAMLAMAPITVSYDNSCARARQWLTCKLCGIDMTPSMSIAHPAEVAGALRDQTCGQWIPPTWLIMSTSTPNVPLARLLLVLLLGSIAPDDLTLILAAPKLSRSCCQGLTDL